MKKYLIFFLLLFQNLYSQDANKIDIIFEVNIFETLADYEKQYENNPLAKEYMIRLKRENEEIKYKLSIDGSNALYESVPMMNIDRVKPSLLRRVLDNKIFIGQNEILKQFKFNDKQYLIYEITNNKDWELINETKQILGYKTLKATLTTNETPKRYIEAWYAPEIPISLGPDGFEGLPGLILQINYNNKKSLRAISLESVNNNFVFPPSQGRRITRKEFNKIIDVFDAELEERYGN